MEAGISTLTGILLPSPAPFCCWFWLFWLFSGLVKSKATVKVLLKPTGRVFGVSYRELSDNTDAAATELELATCAGVADLGGDSGPRGGYCAVEDGQDSGIGPSSALELEVVAGEVAVLELEGGADMDARGAAAGWRSSSRRGHLDVQGPKPIGQDRRGPAEVSDRE